MLATQGDWAKAHLLIERWISIEVRFTFIQEHAEFASEEMLDV